MKTVRIRCCLAAALTVVAAGCRRPAAAPAPAAPPAGHVVHEQRLGRARLRIRANAEAVRLEHDLHLTVETTASPEREVTVSDMDAGSAGFDVIRWYEDPPVLRAAALVRRRHLLLRPRLAEEFRTPALTILVTDRGRTPPERRTYTPDTAPLPLELPVTKAPDDIVVAFDPLAGRQTVLERGAPALLIAAAALLGVLLSARVARRVAAHRRALRPARRALRALRAVEAENLAARGRGREFYQRLIAVVRDFVRDCHRIQAPEQTSSEFLAAIASDERFSASTVAAFARLLEDADRVKFAAAVPPSGAPGRALDFVRSFVLRERGRLLKEP